MSKLSIFFPQDHPSLAGHFPGNPIIPGVMLLEEILNHFQHEYPNASANGFSYVKFMQPLKPEHTTCVDFKVIDNNKVKFVCADNNDIFAQGEIKFSN